MLSRLWAGFTSPLDRAWAGATFVDEHAAG